jgi:hypothetical protein
MSRQSPRGLTPFWCLPGMLNPLAGLSERGRAGTSPANSRLEDSMVFAREQRNAVLKRAITRLLAEDLDLSPADLAYRARMSVNAAKGGRARAKALTPARRRAIICQSTKTSDKRQAAEVLKTKRQELEAARGVFITCRAQRPSGSSSAS